MCMCVLGYGLSCICVERTLGRRRMSVVLAGMFELTYYISLVVCTWGPEVLTVVSWSPLETL